jgi:class 3 adenylate cyclase/alpha-beta hydrolase superfamily lysophospholipase
MEPRIQYAKTSDGVSIAYSVIGEGPPLVYIAAQSGGVHLYSQFSLARRGTDQLASAGLQVIRYDGRGTGSSDRAARDFSLEARLRDLEAVVERLKLERFMLLGHQHGGLTAIAYAERHAGRVSHLILRDPFASITDWYESSAGRRVFKGLRAVAEENWELVTQNIGHMGFGFANAETAKEYAAAIQSSHSAATWVQMEEAADGIDVTELLGAISVPTLVVFDLGIPGRGPAASERGEAAKKVAAMIPDAHFLATDDFAAAAREFLRQGEPPAHSEPVELPSGTAIILFADIADSTALTERLGDAAFRAKARDLGSALRAVIRECAGTPVEGPTLGDGVLAVFTSAKEAIEAAVRCRDEGNREGLPLHLGIHAGDVMREKDPDGRANVYGGAVNIAARIAGASAAGEILVSDIVRGLARTSADVEFEDRGERDLKGISDAQRLFAVRAQKSEG